MFITVNVTTDDLYELYKKNYKDSKLINKIIEEINSNLEAKRAESDELELLTYEFFSPAANDNPDLFMDEDTSI